MEHENVRIGRGRGVRLVHGEAAGKDLVLSRSLTLAPDVDSGGWDGAADARGN